MAERHKNCRHQYTILPSHLITLIPQRRTLPQYTRPTTFTVTLAPRLEDLLTPRHRPRRPPTSGKRISRTQHTTLLNNHLSRMVARTKVPLMTHLVHPRRQGKHHRHLFLRRVQKLYYRHLHCSQLAQPTMQGRRCRAVWAGIRRRRLSKAMMLGSSRTSSRSTRLTCLQEGLGPVATVQVRQVTTIGLLPIRCEAVVVWRSDS
jgi:hypothetical protein